MLARQTRRSISLHRTFSLSPIGRQLRSISPQLATPRLSQRCIVTTHFQPRKRRGSETSRGLPHGRNLATAVDDFSSSPYASMSGPSMLPSYIQPLNSSPLVLPEPSGPRTIFKTSSTGIPGDPEEMLPVFDACIRVGKLDRASLVLKRLASFGVISGEERIMLHNQYLRGSLNQMRISPDRKRAEQLHKWYELEIRNQNIPQTAETIACMLKASLLSERGARLERLINRYMSMAPGEAGLRVLSMADILSDSDLAVITEICPTYNFSPETEEVEAALDADGAETSEVPSYQANLEESEYPEILATPQQGMGLAALKQGLSLISELEKVDISKLSLEEQREFQMRLERDTIDAAISKWRSDHKKLEKIGINTVFQAGENPGSISECMPEWLRGLEIRIREEIAKIDASENRDTKTVEDLERCIYGPLLRQSNATRLAAVTILSVLNHSSSLGADNGVVLARLVNDVARNAQEDIALQLEEKMKKERRRLRKVQFTGGSNEAEAEAASTEENNGEVIIDAVGPENRPRAQQFQKRWSPVIKAQVGTILVKALLETAKVKVIKSHPVTGELLSQNQPAFSHLSAPRKGKKIGLIILNAQLIEHLKREPIGDFISKHLPMVAPPNPWQGMYEGGFLHSKAMFVRIKPGDIEQKLYAKAAIRRGDMANVFKGLDVLGQTAWRVNNDVLDVMVQVWNTGEEFADIPALKPNLEIPPEPVSEDPMVRRAWVRRVQEIENVRSAMHSQRCYMNLQLEIARAYRNQTVYFPHNVDYRGRAYPMPTYLNHMGADHMRSMLKFAKGKELGARGLRWLKIHLANVYGFDKASFEEREAFADDNLANIQESATNPLNGSRWWLKAEDPWQCLAACFELVGAYKLPDPTRFVSQLPVHQDGTCNGLQHYAALGGDTWGAQQVNLLPGSRPADVYSAVANLVRESIAKDATQDHPIAPIVADKITRKVVKQTVMTNVYGVTFAGARAQVCKQIDALYPDLQEKHGIHHMHIASYIARHIFKAMSTMFRGAHDIQYWLGEIGSRVCRALTPAQIEEVAQEYEKETKSKRRMATGTGRGFVELSQQFRSTVVWTTPLRMPVVQPYRKSTMKEIATCLQNIAYSTNEQTDPVNRKKQLQGFPPNFIHSLDACHMLLSAIGSHQKGLDFAAVHDSFWTHAADIDTMNGVLRDCFIKIHEEDVIGRLRTEFEARYKGSLYMARIDSESPVARKIQELRDSSKMSPKEELLLEHKRQVLKASGNPWDLEAAQKIITPASIYEEMSASEEDIEVREAMNEMGIGGAPEDPPAEKATESTESPTEGVEEAGVAGEAEEAEEDVGEFPAPESKENMQNLMKKLKSTLFEKSIIQPTPNKTQSKTVKMLDLWLPLTYPAVPKKGDFNVSQLRESKYFFS